MATIFSNADPGYIPDTRTGQDTADPGYIPAPPKANASTTVTNSQLASLMSALNSSEKRLCTAANGKVSGADVPNTYSIKFAPASLGDATLAIQGKSKAATPMTAKNGNNQLNQNSQQIDYTVRNYSFAAGTPIVAIIDEILKNSSYITSQARAVIDENTKEIKEQPPLGNMAWYKISTQATPKEPYDEKRKGYAYDIEYIVSAYAINSMDSEFFDQAVKRGVHKSYKYWFTGQNTQVLKFEQKFNNVYLTTMTLPESIGTWRQKTKNVLAPREYQAAVAGSSSQGAQGKTNSVGASAADYLYSPTDIGETSITIIGDPAWLQQGETVAGIDSANFNFNPFNPDGTINFDAQQIVFDIQYNTSVDYDAEGTGLANPNVSTDPQAIYTYITKTVKSRFNNGKFEQDIDGVLFQDPFSVKAGGGTSGANSESDHNADGNNSGDTGRNTDGVVPSGTGVAGAAGNNPSAYNGTGVRDGTVYSDALSRQLDSAQSAVGYPDALSRQLDSAQAAVGYPDALSRQLDSAQAAAVVQNASDAADNADAEGTAQFIAPPTLGNTPFRVEITGVGSTGAAPVPTVPQQQLIAKEE